MIGYFSGTSTYQWFNATAMASHTAFGFLILGLISQLRAISDYEVVKKDMLSELKEKDMILELCLKTAKIGKWELDIQKNNLVWNQEMIDIFGLNAGSFEDFENCVHPEDIGRINEAVKACIEDGIFYQERYRIITPDRKERIVEARGDVVGKRSLASASI
ncbi:MAG: PAS domain-containing protein [Anaerolineae bacterium]|nr:PAS domain-containing protein [Anaerolineae bacterium]